jgi:hypothetical protein
VSSRRVRRVEPLIRGVVRVPLEGVSDATEPMFDSRGSRGDSDRSDSHRKSGPPDLGHDVVSCTRVSFRLDDSGVEIPTHLPLPTGGSDPLDIAASEPPNQPSPRPSRPHWHEHDLDDDPLVVCPFHSGQQRPIRIVGKWWI